MSRPERVSKPRIKETEFLLTFWYCFYTGPILHYILRIIIFFTLNQTIANEMEQEWTKKRRKKSIETIGSTEQPERRASLGWQSRNFRLDRFIRPSFPSFLPSFLPIVKFRCKFDARNNKEQKKWFQTKDSKKVTSVKE